MIANTKHDDDDDDDDSNDAIKFGQGGGSQLVRVTHCPVSPVSTHTHTHTHTHVIIITHMVGLVPMRVRRGACAAQWREERIGHIRYTAAVAHIDEAYISRPLPPVGSIRPFSLSLSLFLSSDLETDVVRYLSFFFLHFSRRWVRPCHDSPPPSLVFLVRPFRTGEERPWSEG